MTHAQSPVISRWHPDDRQNKGRQLDQATAHIDLPALPMSPRWARRHAAAALGAWQVDTDVAETTLLLVSELVTNAVTALSTCASDDTTATPIRQTLRREDGRIVAEISDPDPRPPVMIRTGPYAESGRGLLLDQPALAAPGARSAAKTDPRAS